MVRSNLAILMAERNIKMSELVKATGISKTALTDLVYNRSKAIQFNTINRLCLYLDVTPNELISFLPFDIKITGVSDSVEVGSTTKYFFEISLDVQNRKQHDTVELKFGVIEFNGMNGTPNEYELLFIREDDFSRNLIDSLPITFRTDFENLFRERFRTSKKLHPDDKITLRW